MQLRTSKLRKKKGRKTHNNTSADSRWYSSNRWRNVRRIFLKKGTNGYCYYHALLKKPQVLTVVVDHIIRRRAGGASYDSRNFRGCCSSCHNIKRHWESIQSDNGRNDVITAMIPKQRIPTGLIPANTIRLDLFLLDKIRLHEARQAYNITKAESGL